MARLRQYNPITTWKNREQRVNYKGYIEVRVPEHPKAYGDGWYYEHRLIAESRLGRILKSYETVHHINECKTDNREINLFICTRQEHDRAHALTAAAA